jgi:hypothetical protein
MFDLAKAVATWIRGIEVQDCELTGSSVRKAELLDHLYCEIDAGRARGLDDERAFAAAIARLGSAEGIRAEHAKNRPAFWTSLAAVANCERAWLGRLDEHRGALIGHALVWASLILGSSLILAKSALPHTSSLLLTLVFVPGWWVSDQILRRALRGKPGARG